MSHPAVRLLTRIDRAAGGLTADFFLYALSTAFAAVTAATSTLLPHRAWGALALWAYAGASLAVVGQLLFRVRLPAVATTTARAALTWTTWLAAAILPLIVEAAQRAAGRTDRAQEEVRVVERMGERLLHDGTPYLPREAIAALPADDRLLAYSPYQPAMAVFGLPRAAFGVTWWTDARVWFALVTAAALTAATLLLGLRLTRAIQAATVLPICTLTLATGGDDMPVLALCLLALALLAVPPTQPSPTQPSPTHAGGHFALAGVAVGVAAACKLFAFPVVAVLIVLAFAVRRVRALLPGALGLPLLALLPPLLVAPDGFAENVLRFPLGHGLVTSPAQSPFPGYLIAQHAPAGRLVTLALLLAVAAALAVRLIRRPPTTATAAALICGWGLLAAILLMPTTRFGYLLYPIAFLVWAGSLTFPGPHSLSNHTAGRCPPGDPALYRR